MKRYINLRGELFDLSLPRVMAIINVTPDSFYSGSRVGGERAIRERMEELISQGADIVDIGAFSSRPGAKPVSSEEERSRLEMPLTIINKYYPEIPVSVDTSSPDVARRMAENFNIDIINDISGGTGGEEMYRLVADRSLPYILMHMQGTPEMMQDNPVYGDVVNDVNRWFSERLSRLTDHGVRDVILDPGFGFGKSSLHNYEMLARFEVFGIHNLPLLAGISRKSMIWKELGVTPDEALNGTTALNMAALLGGASILRVHDVKEAAETVRLFELIRSGREPGAG